MRPQLSELTNTQPTERSVYSTSPEYHAAMMCTRMAGHAIIRVVGRCNDAKENEKLDLSECQLIQIPEAVFHLMRETTLKTCDLSFNVITKIPAKLGAKFNCITELNISNNKISKLPDELADLHELQSLNISYNVFCVMPRFVYGLPKLEHLNAEKNGIIELDPSSLEKSIALKTVNLLQNPLPKKLHDELSKINNLTVLLSPIEQEDWEKWIDELQ